MDLKLLKWTYCIVCETEAPTGMRRIKTDQNSSHRLFYDFLKGDDSAFDKIYKLYARDLYAFGLSMNIKQGLIEDAIQDVFVDIYIRRKKLPEIENLKLYIMGAFRNRLLTLLSKQEKMKFYAEITDSQMDTQMQGSAMETWIEEEDMNKKAARVKELMTHLNVRQREVLYYRFVDNLSIEDIASLLNINYQSVKNIIHRSIQKLRKLQLKILLFFGFITRRIGRIPVNISTGQRPVDGGHH